jgi:Beta-lactamase
VFENGYGLANLEYDIPVTPHTVCHVASVSKQITARALVLLEQAGKLSLEDDVHKYLPELPDYGHPFAFHVSRFTFYALPLLSAAAHPAATASTAASTKTTAHQQVAVHVPQRHAGFGAARITDNVGSLAEGLRRHRPFGQRVRIGFLDTNGHDRLAHRASIPTGHGDRTP